MSPSSLARNPLSCFRSLSPNSLTGNYNPLIASLVHCELTRQSHPHLPTQSLSFSPGFQLLTFDFGPSALTPFFAVLTRNRTLSAKSVSLSPVLAILTNYPSCNPLYKNTGVG